MKFSKYKDASRQWRWAFYADNGECIAVSSEAYINEIACDNSIALVKSATAATVVVEPGITPPPAVLQPAAEPAAPKPAKRKRATAKRR